MGMAEIKLGKKESACEDLEEAKKIGGVPLALTAIENIVDNMSD
jgi:hypothetical protein